MADPVRYSDVSEALGCEMRDPVMLAAVRKLQAEAATARRQCDDLLAANNRYLERAREAEAARDAAIRALDLRLVPPDVETLAWAEQEVVALQAAPAAGQGGEAP